MFYRHIGDYNFIADPATGFTIRWGKTLHDNPTFAPIPELADISISNHCTKQCSFCYRNSTDNNEFLSLQEYCTILDAMHHPKYGNVFQVALGGGEPLEHPDFIKIIDETIKRGIMPNFTTNGIHLNTIICESIKHKIGAVAISATTINEIPLDKVALLNKYCIKTNIHYVLSSRNIDQATDILKGKYNQLFQGVNAIIFLTYKPAGRAGTEFILRKGDSLNKFCNVVNNHNYIRPKFGFDACFVPILLNKTSIPEEQVDTCESGYFSVYIDHKMRVSPCSFSNGKDAFSLKEYDFYDIWLNKFNTFRLQHPNRCASIDCKARNICRGCCPYFPKITCCYE